MTTLVLTILGPDRVGLVETLADTVMRHEANWLESRMAELSGQFAGLLRVSVPPDQADALVSALRGLAGLQVHVARVDGERSGPARSVTLDLVGSDRPGIVAEITRVLAGQGVNVEDLETRCEPAPMSGEPLFRARAILSVGEEADLDVLATALERIANDLMVELTLDAPG